MSRYRINWPLWANLKTRPQNVIAVIELTVALLLTVIIVNWSRIASFIQPARTHQAGTSTLSHIPPAPAQESVDCVAVKCLALTFDDGPNPLTTPRIVHELERAHVKATFFMVGSRVKGNGPLLRRMHTDGDEIENHSWSHPDFTDLSAQQIQHQIALTQQAIVRTGVPAPTMFRPPYGAVNHRVLQNVPLTILLWNEDPEDWKATSARAVIAAVEGSARAGGIVDMHDIYAVTAHAVPHIIKDLSARGFHFVTVSQLLYLHAQSRGTYYGRYAP
ncbi:MAG TPA: polysaccharide deacetylase family protein [Candidatus Saccharimonadales bacterium]|nr:polysaccharide deacetylase family protein [Candidatus Saccharimonadales bacterium]